jgi:hypothetical protein
VVFTPAGALGGNEKAPSRAGGNWTGLRGTRHADWRLAWVAPFGGRFRPLPDSLTGLLHGNAAGKMPPAIMVRRVHVQLPTVKSSRIRVMLSSLPAYVETGHDRTRSFGSQHTRAEGTAQGCLAGSCQRAPLIVRTPRSPQSDQGIQRPIALPFPASRSRAQPGAAWIRRSRTPALALKKGRLSSFGVVMPGERYCRAPDAPRATA